MSAVEIKSDTVGDTAARRGQSPVRFVVAAFGATRHLLPIAMLVMLWEAGARLGVINANLFSSPSTIGQAMLDLSSTGMLWRDAGASVARVTIGFSIAAAVGVSLGLLLGRTLSLARYVVPLIESLIHQR